MTGFQQGSNLQAALDHRIATAGEAQERILRRVATLEDGTRSTLDRYQADAENMRDFIVPLGKDGRIHYAANGHVNVIERVNVTYDDPARDHEADGNAWTLHPHASRQLGERLGIPGSFLRDLVAGEEWQRKAAADLLEAHTQNTNRQRLLFRAVNGELRGVLSDSYRRINSLKILQTVWEAARALGAVPVSANFNDTRFYAEFLNPKVVTIETPNNGTRHQAFGMRVQNSDFGDGALDLRFLMIEAICYNGAVIASAFRQVHLGARLPDDLELSERTYMLDSQATASAVNDVTRNLLSEARIRQEVEKIQAASADVINPGAELKRLMRNTLTKGEVDRVTELLTASRPEDGLTGAATRFKLSQAVGTLANQAETTPTRARELHEVAGDLLTA